MCFHKTEVNGFTTFMIHDSLGLNKVGVYFLFFGLELGFEVSFFLRQNMNGLLTV